MKHLLRPFRRSALAAVAASSAALALLAAPAHAQGKADVGNLVFEDIQSPDVPIGKNIGFIDQVTVKWYVAFKNPDGKGFIKLSKTINHINVPIEEEIFSSVYMSPSMLKRVTGKDKAGKGDVEAVGIEVLVNGEKVGLAAQKKPEKWWEAGSLSDQSDKFPLLNKDETPFAMFWWDRYAEIQKER